MRRTSVTLSGGAALVALAALAAATVGAQQDTTTRRPATVRVASAGEVAPPTFYAPAADSAIDRLEDFLPSYQNSPLRPNALFRLGELLVRRADEEFAQQQRATA